MKTITHRISQEWMTTLVLLTILLAGCGKPDPAKRDSERFMAEGEREIVGSYRLSNVLLAGGQLVWLDVEAAKSMGIGDTPEQAQEKGVLTSAQGATLLQKQCTMELLPNHTFTITNLPNAGFSQTISFRGTWSLKVYHVFDASRYRISMIGGPKGDLVLSKFYSADLPGIIEIHYREGHNNLVSFRFQPIHATEAGPVLSGR